jgi:Spx/MgsR family transcriptional regulator
MSVAQTLYGIPNCDTVKKARAWLDAAGISHVFHDYKKAGADADRVRHWVDALGWELVLNRQGTTFRSLPEAEKAGLDAARAVDLMLAQPSMIRRPILEGPGVLLAGFKPEAWAAVLRRGT